jgi:serine/threonine-protein kinase
MSEKRTLRDFVLAKRWRFERVIGSGADGTVYLALDLETEKEVAIKVFDSTVDESIDVIKHRIETEASLVRTVQSPWIVEFIQYGVARARGGKQAAYTVMEHLKGGTLRSYLNQHRLSLPEAIRVVECSIRGLSSVHDAGWVHMDIKPENMFVNEQVEPGQPGWIKVFDFGNARPVQTAFTVGSRATPLYAAPEICARSGDVGQHTDVYSLGIMMYEVLAGAPPMPMTSVEQIVSTHVYGELYALPADCPEWIQSVYRRATSRATADRYPDASSMLHDWTTRRAANEAI